MGTANSAMRSAVVTSGALAAVALGSALQVALYLGSFGVSHRTDGFIAAFAVYSLIVVVAQILRTTAVPLLSGPKLEAGAFGYAMVAMAGVVALGGALLASPLARAVAGSAGREGVIIGTDSLRIMAPAAGLQILAAGLAVRAAVEDRLVPVGMAYIVSASVGLISFAPLYSVAQERVLAWTTLIASSALVVVLLLGTGRPAITRPPVTALPGAALSILRGIPVPASFVLMYPVALALAPAVRGGDLTLFGLAFTASSYLAGFTGQGLSMVDAIAYVRLGSDRRAERGALVLRAFSYSLLLAVPCLSAGILIGGPLVHLLVASSTHAQVSFSVDLALLAPWVVATLGLWALLPAVLAHLTRSAERRLNGGVALLLLIHVVACLLARQALGFRGLVAAMAVAPLVFSAAAAWQFVPGSGVSMLRMTAALVCVGAAVYGLAFLLVRVVLPTSLLSGTLAGVVGSVAYLGVCARFFPLPHVSGALTAMRACLSGGSSRS